MSDCQHIQENISAYLDAELGPAERRELHEHVAQCAACRQLLEELSQTADALRSLPLERAPAALAGKLAEDVRRGMYRQTRQRALRERAVGVARVAAMAAALALAMLAGWSVFDAYLSSTPKDTPAGDALAYNSVRDEGVGGEHRPPGKPEGAMAAAENRGHDNGAETHADGEVPLFADGRGPGREHPGSAERRAADSGRDELVAGLNSLGLDVTATHRLTIRTGDPEQAMQVVTNLANTQMQRSVDAQSRFRSQARNIRAQAAPARNFIHQQGIESVVVVMDAADAPHEMEKLNEVFGDALAVDAESEGEADMAAQLNIMQRAATSEEESARSRAEDDPFDSAAPDGALESAMARRLPSQPQVIVWRIRLLPSNGGEPGR